MEQVWLDVQMWTGLRGNFHPFTDLECEAPDPPPATPGDWQRWASQYLGVVAVQEGWQPGRYSYVAERRDDAGHTLQVFTRGQWEWHA
jgi:hypothetical protein